VAGCRELDASSHRDGAARRDKDDARLGVPRLARRPAPAPAEPMKRFTIDVPACLPKLIGLDNLALATKRRQVQTDARPHARGETAQRLTARPVR
jgi:hypothetical protein